MSYTPTNWANGDVITTAKLNKIENGIVEASNSGGGVLVVNIVNNGQGPTLDKTWQQIHDAVLSEGVVLQSGDNLFAITAVITNGAAYSVLAGNTYTTDSISGYPGIQK